MPDTSKESLRKSNSDMSEVFLQELEFAEKLQKEVSDHAAKVTHSFGISILLAAFTALCTTHGWAAGLVPANLVELSVGAASAIGAAYQFAASRSLGARLKYDRAVLHKIVQGMHEMASAVTQYGDFSAVQSELFRLRLSRLDFAARRGRFR